MIARIFIHHSLIYIDKKHTQNYSYFRKICQFSTNLLGLTIIYQLIFRFSPDIWQNYISVNIEKFYFAL